MTNPTSGQSNSYFDSAYGETPPWDIGKPQPDLIALLNEFPPTGPVLEVGCGTGDPSIALAQRGLNVLGVDAAESAIAQARAKAAADPSAGGLVEFRGGDALPPENLPGPYALREQRMQEAKAFLESQRASTSATRGFGCFGRLIGLVIGAALLGLIFIAFDALESPWAYDFFGTRPTLTGEWVAEFTTPSGLHGAAYLNLTHQLPTLSHNGSSGLGSTRWVDGTAQSCFSASAVQNYQVYGRPNTNASDVPLAFRGKPPFVVGYALQDLRGAWLGETLQLSDVLTRFTDTRGSTIYNPNEVDQKLPTTITFHKGSAQDFAAACAKLGS